MERIRLVIDPGHGGDDPGAVNGALRESDIALRIAHVLKAVMDTHPEFNVALTRDSDKTISLKGRTDLANQLDAYLVSIHCNATEDPQANGAEVWCYAETDKDGKESVGHQAAKAIQAELVSLGLRDRCVKAIYDRKEGKYIARKLWVLDKTKRPSVLVECAFISNPEEVKRIGDVHGDFKERLAVAIFKGINKMLNTKGGDIG
jgi:N-acetylmuramoyl-L-alanine amidase